MSDRPVSALPVASSLVGTEQLPVLQSGQLRRLPIGEVGRVRSVSASGGSTGLAFTGGPITGTGALVLEGVLNVTNGGTGGTTPAEARAGIAAAASGPVSGSGLTCPTLRIVGRASSSTGPLETLSVGSGLDITGGTASVVGRVRTSTGLGVGRWVVPIEGSIQDPGSLSANTIRLWTFAVTQPVTIDSLAANVTVPNAGGLFSLAIYASTAGRPTGAPITNTSNLSGDLVAVISGSVSPLALEAGTTYWVAEFHNLALGLASMTNASVTSDSSQVGHLTALDALSLSRPVKTVAQSFGAWPDLTSATIVEAAGGRLPVVAMRVSAV